MNGTCVLDLATASSQTVPENVTGVRKVVQTSLEVEDLDALGDAELGRLAYGLILVVEAYMQEQVPGARVFLAGPPVKVEQRRRALRATRGTVQVPYIVVFPEGTQPAAIESAATSYASEVAALVTATDSQLSQVFRDLGVTKAAAVTTDAPSANPSGSTPTQGGAPATATQPPGSSAPSSPAADAAASSNALAVGVGVGVGVGVPVLLVLLIVVLVKRRRAAQVHSEQARQVQLQPMSVSAGCQQPAGQHDSSELYPRISQPGV